MKVIRGLGIARCGQTASSKSTIVSPGRTVPGCSTEA
jgi:hypothetical protein